MSQIARPHVHIATPCFGGMVTQQYMQSVLGLMQVAGPAGFDLSLSLLGHDSLITRSRNTLVARFLDQAQATHLMFIDADIGFDPHQITRMLQWARPVVGGMYPLKLHDWNREALDRLAGGEPHQTAALRYVGLVEPGAVPGAEGFARAIYAGTGFLLIARAALLRLIAAHPETRYQAIQSHPPRPASPHQFALFDCLIEPGTGIYLSEDYAFCHRWRALGGEIWLDTQGSLSHGEFTGQPRLRFV